MGELLTSEMGKTFAAAKGEAAKCAMTMRYYAEHAEEMLAPEVIATSGSRSGVRFEPLGAIFAVMPWNFPLWQVVRFAAPGLMAGNVAILKHASNVPGSRSLPRGRLHARRVPARRVHQPVRGPRRGREDHRGPARRRRHAHRF